MLEKTNVTICPFCKSQNECMAQVAKPCWCSKTKVPEELIALVPEEANDKACICLSCIKLFKENSLEFMKKYA